MEGVRSAPESKGALRGKGTRFDSAPADAGATLTTNGWADLESRSAV